MFLITSCTSFSFFLIKVLMIMNSRFLSLSFLDFISLSFRDLLLFFRCHVFVCLRSHIISFLLFVFMSFYTFDCFPTHFCFCPHYFPSSPRFAFFSVSLTVFLNLNQNFHSLFPFHFPLHLIPIHLRFL